ncbi:MAG: hypothetical protein ACYTFE_01085 [Planctomycetota bacterium]
MTFLNSFLIQGHFAEEFAVLESAGRGPGQVQLRQDFQVPVEFLAWFSDAGRGSHQWHQGVLRDLPRQGVCRRFAPRR